MPPQPRRSQPSDRPGSLPDSPPSPPHHACPASTALRRVEPHPEQTPPLPSRPRLGCPRRSLPLFLSPSSPSSKQPPRSPGVPRSLPRSPLVSQLLTVPPILSVPLVLSVPSVPWPDMARAAEPERRLLAIYTGGTIGMRSERGGESAMAPEGAASGVAVGWGRLGAVPHSRGHRPHTPSPGHRRACSWTEERSMGLDLGGAVSGQRARAVCGWQLSGPAPGTMGVGSRGLPEHVCPLLWPNKAVGRCLGAASPLTRTTGRASVMGLHTHLF